MDNNPIYKFLKENNYTTKTEEDFLKTYSDEVKAKELHNFMVENEFSKKDFDSFYDEYLKKKEHSFKDYKSTSQTSSEPLNTSQEVDTLQAGNILQNQATDEDIKLQEQGLRRIIVDIPTIGDSGLTRKGEFIIPESAVANNPRLVEERDSDGKKEFVVKYLDSEGVEQVTNEKLPKPITDKGVMSDLSNSLMSGLSILNNSLAGLPELVYSIGALPQNLIADVTGIEGLRANYEDISEGSYNPLGLLSKYSNQQKQLSEDYANQITQFENSIGESLTNGNLSDAGRQVVNSIVQSTPSMLGMLMTSGAGSASGLGTVGRSTLNALPFASGEYQQIKDDETIPESVKVLSSLAKGFSEVIFEESFGTLPIMESILNKSLGKEQLKEVVEGYFKGALSKQGVPASFFKGAVSEMATEVSNNIIDVYGTQTKDSIDWKRVLDAGIVGSAMDGGLSIINTLIPDKAQRTRATELESQITSLKKDLDKTENVTQSAILERTLENKVSELDSIITEVQELNLTQEQKSKLNEISVQRVEIEAMLENENLTEEVKLAIQEELNNLDNQTNEIVKNNTEVPVESTSDNTTIPQQEEQNTLNENETTNIEGALPTDVDVEPTQSPVELEVEGEIQTPSQVKLQEIQDRRQAIRERIRSRLGNLNTGLNPEQIGDFVALGATYVEEGVVRFSDFVSKLQEDFQDSPKLLAKLKDKDLREIFKQSVEANGLKLRGFTESTRTSPKVSETTQAIVDNTNDSVTYEPQVLSEIQERLDNTSEADKLLKVGKLGTLTNNFSADDNDAVLAGISLINQYEAEGRNDESAKIIEQMAKSATVMGQALRQYGEFKNSTPKGYIHMIETLVKEKGKELNDTNRTKIETLFKEFQVASDNFQKAGELTGSDTSQGVRKQYLEAEIALEKSNRVMADYIGKIYGKDTGELLSQILQGNLLTFKSLVINPFSNTIQAGVRSATNTVAWLLDQIFFNATIGTSTKLSPFDKDAVRLGTRGVLEGLSKAKRKAFLGDASIELNKYDIGRRLKPFTAFQDLLKSFTSEDFNEEFSTTNQDRFNNLVESTLGITPNLMFRALPFGDDPFFQQARTTRLIEIGKKNKGLNGEALEKFVNKPDEKSELEAVEYAKSATFQDATKLAQFIRGGMSSIQDIISTKVSGVPFIGKTLDATVKVILKAVIPFVGTPSSILQKTIRFSVPLVPLVDFSYQIFNYAKILKRKGKNHVDTLNAQRKIVEVGAEVIVSGAVISVATTLVALGLVSGDAPDEKERAKEKNFMFQTLPPNHLNISGLLRYLKGEDPTWRQGDRSASTLALGLIGAQIAITESTMGAKLRDDFKKSKIKTTSGKNFYEVDKSKQLLDYMFNVTDNLPASLRYFMGQSIVQSSETILEAISTGQYDQFGNQMVRTLSNIGIPNQVSQYFRATNDYMRDIYTEEDLQTWANIIKEKTANVEDLPMKYNMWGEPISQTPKGENPYVYQMVDIFRSQQILQDETTYKVFDLFKKTQNNAVIPTSARDFYADGDFTVKLNKEQKSELTRLVGERRKIKAEKVLRNYTKDSVKPEKFVEKLKKAYSEGAKEGKRLFMKQLRQESIEIKSNEDLKTSDDIVNLETNNEN